jgi:hypothetical protein
MADQQRPLAVAVYGDFGHSLLILKMHSIGPHTICEPILYMDGVLDQANAIGETRPDSADHI